MLFLVGIMIFNVALAVVSRLDEGTGPFIKATKTLGRAELLLLFCFLGAVPF